MLKNICKFLSILLVAFTCNVSVAATANIPNGNIGDYGSWATKENHEMLMSAMKEDFNNFEPQIAKNQIMDDYVPVEAKVGMAFMNAMTHVGAVLDSALVRFAVIFILIMYAFWIGFEAYMSI
ncbi:MAG: hypothetical protein II219_00095, partial [Alphaproteobacteria bacterium]|nr:hypothetical protein [Alphaproteobacteria bacterium]